ncbi:MAG: hypothetical protein ACD_78C00464G0002 [uncultured bacterium (gcode 4)]|uniref:Uncharacterized protein n=1 Tax=uncultured bacterium (gcode 4) TaxID=1234023 RepID=K1XG85_9BACT|nr:MAG: hypothetical protein ACD_78C00464G0002 [uncultured bacterium (gcode 4)]
MKDDLKNLLHLNDFLGIHLQRNDLLGILHPIDPLRHRKFGDYRHGDVLLFLRCFREQFEPPHFRECQFASG